MKLALLDRDGVINRERGEHTWKEQDFEILPDALEAIRSLQEYGCIVLIISNQSGITLGLYSHEDVIQRHGYLNRRLEGVGADMIGLYYCPHHPDKGKCLCRKPRPALVQRALAATGVPAHEAFMIGDKERDVQAAETVGVKGIRMEANTSLLQVLEENQLLRG